MTSETDSNSSLLNFSPEQEQKCKLHKKIKKNTLKKSKKEKRKKHKEKKRSRKEKSSDNGTKNKEDNESRTRRIENVVGDAFGPALPMHLLNRQKNDKSEALVIGPTMPKELLQQTSKTQNISEEFINFSQEENLQDTYGPLPVNNERGMSDAQIKLEERALELKMAAIEGISAASNEQNVREQWMLELPEVGLKTGLASLSNLKRSFHHGKEKPDFSDRSSWTKTPQTGNDKPKPASSKSSQQELELQAQILYEKQRDAEQEAIAKKHKREQSLVDLHQRKMRKEEKKKSKELKASGAKLERRPFTRDIDLKLNKIDRNQTKQIVDKAKILNTKFASGHSKYL